MNKSFVIILIIFTALLLILSGCNKDNPISGLYTGESPSSLQGNWTVDQIQLLSAPNTGTANALMKTALLPFGLMSASNIGWTNVNFGGIKWNKINAGTNSYLDNIEFRNDHFGWIDLNYYSSSFLKTTDGGNSWININMIDCNFRTFNFFNENTGWAVGSDSSHKYGIHYTTNGGINWNLKSNIQNESIYSIFFVDNNTGWASGTMNTNGIVLKTTNGGSNWVRQTLYGTVDLRNIKFLNYQFGFVYGSTNYGLAAIRKTTDGGNSWTAINIPNVTSVSSLCFMDNMNGYALGFDQYYGISLYKTEDGGASWLKKNIDSHAKCISFINASTGTAVGYGLISKTTNGGTSWIYQSGSINYDLSSVYQRNTGFGIAVGNNGVILKQSASQDSTIWSITGQITDPIIKAIVKSRDEYYSAIGNFYRNDSNIIFNVTDYSGGMGNTTFGAGTYYFTDKLNIKLNLDNEEKWLITLKR